MTKTLTTVAVLTALGAGLAATPSMAAGYRDRDSFSGAPQRYETPVERAYKAGKADGKHEAYVEKRFERESHPHFRPWWARHGFGANWGYGNPQRRWW